MPERFIVVTASGTPVVRTNSQGEAARYARILRGDVVDRSTRERMTDE